MIDDPLLKEELNKINKVKERKNNDFIQLYIFKNIAKFRELTKKSASARIVLDYLTHEAFNFKYISETETAHVVATYESLAKELEMNVRTVARSIELLEEMNFIKILDTDIGKIFALNPNMHWSSHDSKKWKAAYVQGKVVGKMNARVVYQAKNQESEKGEGNEGA
jgi:DNA-binding transcriptional regulator YhcF (GntR family)